MAPEWAGAVDRIGMRGERNHEGPRKKSPPGEHS